MTGTPRKTAPRKAQPKKVASAVVPAPPEDDSFDLASILAVDGGDPVPIKLLGVHGNVLRSFTGEQAIEFSRLVGNPERDFSAILRLITDVGDELWDKISVMGTLFAVDILNKITEMSGLYEGKLFAPLSPSIVETAGAQPSQDSAANTS